MTLGVFRWLFSERGQREATGANVLLETVSDTVSAQAMADRLCIEGIPAEVREDPAILGEARTCRILVPSGFEHRARRVFSNERVPEDELAQLATGAPDPDAATQNAASSSVPKGMK